MCCRTNTRFLSDMTVSFLTSDITKEGVRHFQSFLPPFYFVLRMYRLRRRSHGCIRLQPALLAGYRIRQRWPLVTRAPELLLSSGGGSPSPLAHRFPGGEG